MPNAPAQTLEPLHLGLVLYPGCMPAGLFAASDMARAGNLRSGRVQFLITWVAAELRSVPTWQGPGLQPQATLATAACDAWLVPGMWASSAQDLAPSAQQPLTEALAALPRTAQLWSYCAGVPWVAEAGRLARKSATATWWLQGVLEARFPRVNWRFDEPLVRDGNVLTAAGPHGYLPLMLDALSRRLSAAELHDVQDLLMLPRPQARHSLFRAADLMAVRDPQLQSLLLFAQRTPAVGLSLQLAAAHLHVSVRTLCRQVQAGVGLPAGEWLRRIKLRQAAEALTRTASPVKHIADQLGYASETGLHRAFRSLTGETPAAFRRRYAEPLR